MSDVESDMERGAGRPARPVSGLIAVASRQPPESGGGVDDGFRAGETAREPLGAFPHAAAGRSGPSAESVPTWQIQEGKQRFSELIRAAVDRGPQFITKHGQEIAVVVDIATYRSFHHPEPRMGLAEFLLTGPKSDLLADLVEQTRLDSREQAEHRSDRIALLLDELCPPADAHTDAHTDEGRT